MIIRKCDLCGKEEKEPREIYSAFSSRNIVLSCDDAVENVISGLDPDNIISAIRQRVSNLKDQGKVTNICLECCRGIKRNLLQYYADQAEQIVPVLFDEKLQDQSGQKHD